MGHREDLLAAAGKLISEKGYARITARDLVAESGTNLASIGYHFGSKEALLNAAIFDAFSDWTTYLANTAMTAQVNSPHERAVITWAAMLNDFHDQQPLLVAVAEALAQAERTPELRHQFAEQYRAIRSRVAGYVAEAVDGLSAEDPRTAAIASFMIAVCDGFAMQWLIDADNTPSPAELINGLTLLFDSVGRDSG
ncbi:TetR/AcrR family transcriptional regulator [Hoyosella altamirensis]|uniref:AcrR family transcriptional regulator n=1 Tax=Hoyosella altamirensis TaxID=616997 RepID=A0A839RJ50_9ACTN|nr:TetR/AcrR family transcriptional regulator [Hoyosella altamirensis]MBB3036427.1 AcrR family transcriptional regulator [Hoyosella altamirensis]